jgi:hypothetical protein
MLQDTYIKANDVVDWYQLIVDMFEGRVDEDGGALESGACLITILEA